MQPDGSAKTNCCIVSAIYHIMLLVFTMYTDVKMLQMLEIIPTVTSALINLSSLSLMDGLALSWIFTCGFYSACSAAFWKEKKHTHTQPCLHVCILLPWQHGWCWVQLGPRCQVTAELWAERKRAAWVLGGGSEWRERRGYEDFYKDRRQEQRLQTGEGRTSFIERVY